MRVRCITWPPARQSFKLELWPRDRKLPFQTLRSAATGMHVAAPAPDRLCTENQKLNPTVWVLFRKLNHRHGTVATGKRASPSAAGAAYRGRNATAGRGCSAKAWSPKPSASRNRLPRAAHARAHWPAAWGRAQEADTRHIAQVMKQSMPAPHQRRSAKQPCDPPGSGSMVGWLYRKVDSSVCAVATTMTRSRTSAGSGCSASRCTSSAKASAAASSPGCASHFLRGPGSDVS